MKQKSEQEIIKSWKGDITIPVISISCVTYNHEKYISEAVDSFLMQETEYAFEVVIGEDCSTDKTLEIVKKYKEQYPRIIKLIEWPENVGAEKNWLTVLENCKGKYIANCEGDDYWVDPFKLQKQVSYLEVNPDYGLVHSDCNFLNSNNNKYIYSANKTYGIVTDYDDDQDKLFYLLIQSSMKIRTPTVMYRNKLLKEINEELQRICREFLMGDTPLWLLLSRITKFHYFDEVMAVYRITENSGSRPIKKINSARFALSMVEMRIYFLLKYDKPIPDNIQNLYNNRLLIYKTYNHSYLGMYEVNSTSFVFRHIIKKMHLKLIRYGVLLFYKVQMVAIIFLQKTRLYNS